MIASWRALRPPPNVEEIVGTPIRPAPNASAVLWDVLARIAAAMPSPRTGDDGEHTDEPQPEPSLIVWWALSTLEPADDDAIGRAQQRDRERLRRMWREVAEHLRAATAAARSIEVPAYYRSIVLGDEWGGNEGQALRTLDEAAAKFEALLAETRQRGRRGTDRTVWNALLDVLESTGKFPDQDAADLILRSDGDWTVPPCPLFVRDYRNALDRGTTGDGGPRDRLLGLLRQWRFRHERANDGR